MINNNETMYGLPVVYSKGRIRIVQDNIYYLIDTNGTTWGCHENLDVLIASARKLKKIDIDRGYKVEF